MNGMVKSGLVSADSYRQPTTDKIEINVSVKAT